VIGHSAARSELQTGLSVETLQIRPADGDKDVHSKRILDTSSLEALVDRRPAERRTECSTVGIAVKRRIRVQRTSAQNPDVFARAILKRLTTIGRSGSFIDWQNQRRLIEDLEAQHRAINQVAKTAPAEALELTWRFMALANSVLERCDDSNGTVIGIFHAACRDLGEIAHAAKVSPEGLAARAYNALNEND